MSDKEYLAETAEPQLSDNVEVWRWEMDFLLRRLHVILFLMDLLLNKRWVYLIYNGQIMEEFYKKLFIGRLKNAYHLLEYWF